MARLRPIRRSNKYENIVQVLAGPKGTTVFGTIKQLMIFAAMLGFSKKKRKKLNPADGYEDIMYETFTTDDSHDYIFLIAVAHSGDASILAEENDEEIVTIFEEYANGGFEIIADWMFQNKDLNVGYRAIASGLLDGGFMKNSQVSIEELKNSMVF
jgi:dnd system-associated protein 4